MRIRSTLLSLLLTAALTASAALLTAPGASAQTTAEARFVAKINYERRLAGLPPLEVRSRLTDYARAHSAAMSRQNTLFHTSNFSVLCCWSRIAENVGVGFDVATLHQALMASPAHRANILDPRMRKVGVGVYRSGGRIWVTQIFKAPAR